jgi:hypothetical protein
MMTVGAALLLGAGSARAYDGWAGDTGGPPPPETSEQTGVVQSQPLTFRDGPSAIYAGWPGDTGGPPPIAENAGTEKDAPAARIAAARSVRSAPERNAPEFTDRG